MSIPGPPCERPGQELVRQVGRAVIRVHQIRSSQLPITSRNLAQFPNKNISDLEALQLHSHFDSLLQPSNPVPAIADIGSTASKSVLDQSTRLVPAPLLRRETHSHNHRRVSHRSVVRQKPAVSSCGIFAIGWVLEGRAWGRRQQLEELSSRWIVRWCDEEQRSSCASSINFSAQKEDQCRRR
jgi:hypothetical protein